MSSKAEKSYIQSGLKLDLRADGRALTDYRPLTLETGVSPLSNGSAKVGVGVGTDGAGGTEIIAATKLEVEDIVDNDNDGGRVACTVTCTPTAYPHLSSSALEDLQSDYTTLISQTLTHPSLRPKDLGIIPRKKAWLLNVDVLVMADAGNVYDAMFMAIRAALWDTKVPKTRSVMYQSQKGSSKEIGDMDVDSTSGFDIRKQQKATDFELPDYWDEGDPLQDRHIWPICVTLNVLDSTHFLDATLEEELSVPLRVILLFTFPATGNAEERDAEMQGMRSLGTKELTLAEIQQHIQHGQQYAKSILQSVSAKLREEDVRRSRRVL